MSSYERNKGLRFDEAAAVLRRRFRGWSTQNCNRCDSAAGATGPQWPRAVFELRPMVEFTTMVSGPFAGQPNVQSTRLLDGERVASCPRCMYRDRFNVANRLAAEAGDPLPIWGVWQPAPGSAPWGYDPWTGQLLGLPATVVPPVPAPAARAPKGFVVVMGADGVARAQRPLNDMMVEWKPTPPFDERTAHLAQDQLRLPLADMPTGPIGRAPCSMVPEVSAPPAPAQPPMPAVAAPTSWDGQKLQRARITTDAARLFATGYTAQDFRDLAAVGVILCGER